VCGVVWWCGAVCCVVVLWVSERCRKCSANIRISPSIKRNGSSGSFLAQRSKGEQLREGRRKGGEMPGEGSNE